MAKRFADLEPALLDSTLAALRAQSFETMTPVQSAAIPLLLSHKDVCVEVRRATRSHAAGLHRLGQDTRVCGSDARDPRAARGALARTPAGRACHFSNPVRVFEAPRNAGGSELAK
jgi:hypothetical protein